MARGQQRMREKAALRRYHGRCTGPAQHELFISLLSIAFETIRHAIRVSVLLHLRSSRRASSNATGAFRFALSPTPSPGLCSHRAPNANVLFFPLFFAPSSSQRRRAAPVRERSLHSHSRAKKRHALRSRAGVHVQEERIKRLTYLRLAGARPCLHRPRL